MLLFDGAAGLVMLGLWLFCIIDVITTPESSCRNLPKLLWLLIVILLPDIGSIAWLIAGHPWNAQQSTQRYNGNRGDGGAAPGRPRALRQTRPQARPVNPDDDEEFLAELRARAEEQRRRAREAKQRDETPDDQPPNP